MMSFGILGMDLKKHLKMRKILVYLKIKFLINFSISLYSGFVFSEIFFGVLHVMWSKFRNSIRFL